MSSNDHSAERLHSGYVPDQALELVIQGSFLLPGAVEVLSKCSLNTCESTSTAHHVLFSSGGPSYP